MGECKEDDDDGQEGRERWPGGARPSRWRRRASAGGERLAEPPADVGQAQAERGAAAAARRGSGTALARTGGHRGRAHGLARCVPGGRRSFAQDPAGGWSRRRDRPAQGQGRRTDHGERTARRQDRPPGDAPPFGTTEVEAMSRVLSPSTSRAYGIALVSRLWRVARAT